MPSLFSRLRPGPCPGRCPRWLWGRRPRRLRLPPPPPPPEGLPGPAFIVLSNCFAHIADFYGISEPRQPRRSRKAPPNIQNRIHAVTGSHWAHDGTNPNSSNKLLFENETFSLLSFRLRNRFSVYRIRKAPPRIGWRGRPARERGLNENIFMVLVLAEPRKAPPSQLLHRRT